MSAFNSIRKVEVLDRLAEVSDAIIREVYLTRQVSAGVTDEAMRGRYDAFVAASPASYHASLSRHKPRNR